MSSPRKSFPLRISKDVYDEIKSWAEQELRSVNSQIEFVLKQALRQRKRKSDEDKVDANDES